MTLIPEPHHAESGAESHLFSAAKPGLFHPGLSGKLLLLTIVFVMLAEILIYVPSIANYRRNWLTDRITSARTAALVLEAAPSGAVPDSLAQELLKSVGALAVALKTGPARRLLALDNVPPQVDDTVDLRELDALSAISQAFDTLLAADGRILRVMGQATLSSDFVEIVIDETALRRAMINFSWNIGLISLLISGITAFLVYLTLNWLFVRPMRHMRQSILHFRADPVDRSRLIVPSGRRDELGIAEEELRSLQQSMQEMLEQRSRMAALGLAVSKINHELRNMLSSAQLFSDRLAMSADPTVQRLSPKLISTLDRAIAFCQSTLDYGRAQELPPDRQMTRLATLVDDVADMLSLSETSHITFVNAVDPLLLVEADADQLLRVILNLVRNAREVLEARAPNNPARDQIRVMAQRAGSVVTIDVIDTGDGLNERAKTHLFEAFQGSTRPGGTGLGLAISADIIRAHGGSIRLMDSPGGAHFRIAIPDQPIDLVKARRRVQRL